MALLLLLLIPNNIQAEQKPWEHGRLQVCGFHLGPVMCVVMPIGVCLQAVAGTPMAIMPSFSSTNLAILRPIQIKRYGLMHLKILASIR